MRKEGNTLYFESHESERFLRAIKLLGRKRGYNLTLVNKIIEHERAHIYKARELGCEDRIRYSIEITGEKIGVMVNSEGLTYEERLKVALAPKVPSNYDFAAAVGLKRFAVTARSFADSGKTKTISDLKEAFLKG